jgi:hypothetical protein
MSGNKSVIIGGTSNTVNHINSVVVGGTSLQTTADDQVVVPTLLISGSGGGVTFSDGTTQTTAAGGTTFPFTGSAIISGSLEVTGSFKGNVGSISVASNTASLNCSEANFFDFTIPGSATTHISASNIQPGQTINVLFNQEDNDYGSVTFAPNFKFAGDIAYQATQNSGSRDIVSIISFGTSALYTVSVKNLL